MSNLSMVEAKLPPGFRFHPRDDELVCDYLLTKIAIGSSNDSMLLIEVDLNKSEPWEIPDAACIGGKEWYFYSLRDRKYATGSRTNRATATGYWKATGKDRSIFRKGILVGMRKTLVFYQGRAPKGRKTDWVMHEFRVEGPQGPPKMMPSSKEDWVLCRVFFKNRDHVSKPTSVSSSYELTRCDPSSLPPLLDSFISFDPTPNSDTILDQYDEQVPCFSIFSQQQHPPNPFLCLEMIDTVISTTTTTTTTGSCNYGGDTYTATSDKKVLKAFLNQLTKMEDPNPNHGKETTSVGEGSSESFLSEAGMSTYTWSTTHY